MNINTIVVGAYRENCYIIENNKECIVVDPGDESSKIIDYIECNKLKLNAVLITHAHFDHIGALSDLIEKYNCDVYYHNVNNEIYYTKLIDVFEKEYTVDSFKFKVIYTPGHRNDSVTYYFYDNNIMFTGDFLFKDSIGRMDLEYANEEDMKKSIELIKKYDDTIIIYPGHGEKTILGYEKVNNYYF